MPQAPTPPIKDIVITSDDPELVEILKEIKQILDIREGRLGDTGFRFIDYYELIELLAGDETITITVLPGAHSHPHNDTTAKQGGTTDEFYHLTLAEHTALGTHPDHNDLAGIQGGSAGQRYHLTAAELAALHPPDIIAEGDSSVEVIDTGTGEIKGTVDALQVFRAWNSGGFGNFNVQTQISAGLQDTQAGFLYLYGHATGFGGAGGQLALFCDEDTYGTVVAYIMQPIDGDLRLGPAAIQDALKYDSATDHWHFKQTINLLSGLLETDPSTPTDLEIDCGALKTLKITEPVYQDINVGGAQLNPIPAFAPDLEKFLDEGGGDTGIYTLAFDTNESASGAFEIQHDYKEGTDISFHIHWQGIAAPTGTDYVKWELTYTIVRYNETVDAATVITIETPIDTQYKMNTSAFPDISGSTGGNNGGPIKMGDQFLLTVKRIAATGDAYSGDALVMTAGLHYEIDTLGSRQIGVK